ncbi:MAG: hypothetical protein L0Y55_01870 [Anaerolineales bacterium]|nr:hypothetical protein [Anaerolineales bacterium]
MNFQEAEKTYRDLRAQHDAGKLSDSTFEAEVGKLRMQDAQGRWWQIGVQTGEWYMHDGQKWNKAKPPVTAPPADAAPSPEITAVIPRPVTNRAAAPAKAEPAPKKNGGSALPARLFSSKPAGRNGGGGLSRNALIGIIAGVAVLCIVLAVVGYFLLQGPLSSIAKANTPTPTRALVLPTIPPPPTQPPRPTDTPLPPPTPVVTITLPLPPTPTATRGAVVVRTATKAPTAGPQVSPTVSAPPGVYALKLETAPSKIDVGGGDKVKVGFKLTVLNSTGGMQTRKLWFVRVFADPEQTSGDTAYRSSYGESLKFDVNIGTGTVEVTTPEHVQFGTGRCTYVAIPYYTDDNNIAVPFQTIKGGPLYYSFKVCQ